MGTFPKDCSSRVIAAHARKMVHYIFPSEDWEYHEMTGCDNGMDCILELVEDEKWHNKKIEGQIKGTRSLRVLKNNEISISIDIKTILYGLSSLCAFVVFMVDVSKNEVYYLPIQDYFISQPALFDKIESDQKTMTLHIPLDNLVLNNLFELKQLAKSVYLHGPSRELKRDYDECTQTG